MHTPEGGFAEYCTIPVKAAIKIPDDIPLDTAAFAEPVACCLHGINNTKIRPGDHVLIIGGGTIGLIITQLVKISGAALLSVIEPDEAKRALALKFGADTVFANSTDYFDYYAKTPDMRADRVIECVGKAETVSDSIKAATKGATVMLFGLTPPDAAVTVYPFEIFKKELHITSSFVNLFTESRAIDLLSSGRINVTDLISEKIPLDKLPDVLMKPDANKTKILVDLSLGSK